MKLKVCGMKFPNNINNIVNLSPDYLGFIFYEQSPRNFKGVIPKLPKTIQAVGVFVNETHNAIVAKVIACKLNMVQLHGDETPSYIIALKKYLPQIKVIKAFGVSSDFDFSKLASYQNYVDYFLFDTKGKQRGGNGIAFNWSILECYPFTKPYFLSGGIGLENINVLRVFLASEKAKYCIAVDVNSKFEIKAGLKSEDKIKQFKQFLIKRE